MVNERVIGDQLPMRMPLVDVVSALPGSSSFCERYIDWEKCTILELEVYFTQWTKPNFKLRMQHLYSPDELLQRGKVKGRIHWRFCIKDRVVGT